MTDFTYNDVTIDAYNTHLDQYLLNTPSQYGDRHDFFLHWIDTALAHTPKEGIIFEIGSGHGRNARHIGQKGYNIIRSDASQSFVDYLNQRNEPTQFFNVLRHDFPSQYDTIFADAVLPHFKPEHTEIVLRKIHAALKPGGIFAFATKQGVGEEWINEKDILGRYTYYWGPEALRALIEKAGYELILFEPNIGGADLPNRIWIHVIARKPAQV